MTASHSTSRHWLLLLTACTAHMDVNRYLVRIACSQCMHWQYMWVVVGQGLAKHKLLQGM